MRDLDLIRAHFDLWLMWQHPELSGRQPIKWEAFQAGYQAGLASAAIRGVENGSCGSVSEVVAESQSQEPNASAATDAAEQTTPSASETSDELSTMPSRPEPASSSPMEASAVPAAESLSSAAGEDLARPTEARYARLPIGEMSRRNNDHLCANCGRWIADIKPAFELVHGHTFEFCSFNCAESIWVKQL